MSSLSSSSSSSSSASRSAHKELVAAVGRFLELGFSLLPTAAASNNSNSNEIEHACDALRRAAAPDAELAAVARPELFECMRFVAPDAGFHEVRANVPAQFHAFFAVQIPSIALSAYAERVLHYMRCSPEAYIVALVLIHRAARAGLPVTTRSAHRVLVAALILAAKMTDDKYFQLSYYSQVSGLPLQELGALEMALATTLEFSLHVPAAQYASMVFALRCFVEQGAGKFGFSWARIAPALAMPATVVCGEFEVEQQQQQLLARPTMLSVEAEEPQAKAGAATAAACECGMSRVLSVEDGMSLLSPHSTSLVLSTSNGDIEESGCGSIFPRPVFTPQPTFAAH